MARRREASAKERLMFTRRYRCPDCRGEFNFDHHPSVEADPAPRFCPMCGFDTHADEPLGTAVVAPHIATGTARSVDGSYRAVEEGSEFRAQMAQEMGMDAEGANALKITDMVDRQREGDIAAVPVNNPVTQFMQHNPGSGGFTGGNNAFPNPAAIAAQTSANVQSGPYPNAGAAAMHRLREAHRQFTAGAGHAGATSSDTPANEITQNPNYRPRVRAV
jgi:hypothetical protein